MQTKSVLRFNLKFVSVAFRKNESGYDEDVGKEKPVFSMQRWIGTATMEVGVDIPKILNRTTIWPNCTT